MRLGRFLPSFLAHRPIYRVVVGLLVLLARAAPAQTPYAHFRAAPDSVLIGQARQLCQHFTEDGWANLAAELAARPAPVYSYLNLRPAPTTRLLVPYPLTRSHTGTPLPDRRSTRLLHQHLRRLSLQRRQQDYARLSAVLRTKASKVRQLEKALPVLQFTLDSAGRAQDVSVDPKRSHMGLTARSRKLILTALRTENFQAREVRYSFRQPRPFEEWRRRASRQVGHVSYKAFGWLVYKQVKRRGRCATVWYEEVPRIRFRRWGQ